MAQPNLFGTLCIRADAGELQGIGHVMRCLALAQAWQDRGGMVLFITATKTPALLDRLASEGCKLQLLKAVPASVDDAAETSALAVKAGAAWIVVDGYQFNADYLRALKADSRTLFVVDDFACGGLADADLVLNQNLRAETAMDAGLVDRNQMLGSRFALLRREFRSPGTPARAGSAESPQRASRIVVTFGGSDPGNVTGRVLELLAGFRDWRLQITVLVGPANPHRSDLASVVAALQEQHEVTLLVDPPDLPRVFAEADLAVSAAGSSCWELACLGTPMALIVTADNQRAGAVALAAAGLAVMLNMDAALTESGFMLPLRRLLADRALRHRLSAAGRQLIDGRGALRVAERLATHPLRLRAATSADAQLLHAWANDPLTRRMSFATDPIPWDAHIAWLTRQLADVNCNFFIAEDAASRPVGQARLIRIGTSATLSIGLAPEARGQGLAARLVRLAAVESLLGGWCRRVEAWVRPDNGASLAAFRRAGFTDCGVQPDHAQGAVMFTFV